MRKRKLLTFVALIMVMVFLVSTAAMAVDALTLEGVTALDSGVLQVIATSDYVGEDDLNFTAKTENGDLSVSNAVVLRNEGTTWFVLLDYGRYINDNATAEQDRILKGLAGLVSDIDDGALVNCDVNPDITIEKANAFRDTLVRTPPKSDPTQLAVSLRRLMEYIQTNRDLLMPNVAVVVLTPGREATADITREVQSVLSQYSIVTTHIVCTAGSEANYGAATDGWRDRAAKLAQKGSLTIGGTGYLTSRLDEAEAEHAVTRIREAERRLMMILLKAKKVDVIGYKLTLNQTVAGGKVLTGEGKLSEETYKAWQKGFKTAPEPSDSPDPTPEPRYPVISGNGGSTFFTSVDTTITSNSEPSGLPIEWIIGIALGVVIIALIIILLIVRSRGRKKPTSAGYVQVGSAGSGSSAQTSGTTVTLNGTNGAVLKGTMKNNKLTIGRDASRGAMIAIPNDGKLSGLHATLTKQGSVMTLEDNNSTNGTKVNGNRITSPVILQQNDTVTMGSTTYTVTWR